VRRIHLIAASIFVVAALAMGIALWPREETPVVAEPTTTTLPAPTTTTTAPPSLVAGWAADPVGDHVDLYAAPGDAQPNDTLTNPTIEDVPLAMLVKEVGPTGWLRVQYPKRPNEATAWVRAEQVTTRPVENRLIVSVTAHTLTVYRGQTDQVLFQAPVATGKDSSPTPLGSFYIDIVVDLLVKTGVYGPYQLSVAAFSDVFHSFGGGVGQIAIHGTNQPNLIGNDVSNGCIRMNNEDITTLVGFVRTGSPVQIVA
jgi:lipoprotein-anchoring transpeptidase ErfK/SrfK